MDPKWLNVKVVTKNDSMIGWIGLVAHLGLGSLLDFVELIVLCAFELLNLNETLLYK